LASIKAEKKLETIRNPLEVKVNPLEVEMNPARDSSISSQQIEFNNSEENAFMCKEKGLGNSHNHILNQEKCINAAIDPMISIRENRSNNLEENVHIREIIEKRECEGKSIGCFILMENLNLGYFTAEKMLRDMGYQWTNDIDKESGMHIWKKSKILREYNSI
jgi:hypothetical protein